MGQLCLDYGVAAAVHGPKSRVADDDPRFALERLHPVPGGYFPTTMTEKEPGTMGPRRGRLPCPSGAGVVGAAYSAAIRRIRPVFASIVIVFAPGIVLRFCSTSKVVGLVSLMIVSVPSPCELNASPVLGLKPAPSVPRPIGRSARYLPSFASKI